MRTPRKAAHFLCTAELAGSPLNEAVVGALQELGYDVDLYAPAGGGRDSGSPGARIRPVEYGKRWILRHAALPRWRQYAMFSGTTEDPMGVVGILSWLHRRPSFTLADEIKSDAYRGDRPEWWKRLCRWAIRRSRLSIVGDPACVDLQREYASLPPRHPVVVYPSCFRRPPAPGDRRRLRRQHHIADDAVVLVYSGTFSHLGGAEWMLSALDSIPELRVVAQLVDVDPLTRVLLQRTRHSDRLHVEDRTGDRRLPWREAWWSVVIGDIGMAAYHHPGSHSQRMGTCSNRVCMYLAMGLPVITSRQPSFAFVEEYDCGLMADTEEEFVRAVESVAKRLPEMKRNALRCADEYIDAGGRYEALVAALAEIR